LGGFKNEGNLNREENKRKGKMVGRGERRDGQGTRWWKNWEESN